MKFKFSFFVAFQNFSIDQRRTGWVDEPIQTSLFRDDTWQSNSLTFLNSLGSSSFHLINWQLHSCSTNNKIWYPNLRTTWLKLATHSSHRESIQIWTRIGFHLITLLVDGANEELVFTFVLFWKCVPQLVWVVAVVFCQVECVPFGWVVLLVF